MLATFPDGKQYVRLTRGSLKTRRGYHEEAVKKVKKEANDKNLSDKEKKKLTNEEKEYKSLRKQIQDKLIKFATRVPVFMYLTDYRERCLKDVIIQLEPGLFKKITGVSVKDFELLVSLDVFNSGLMNDGDRRPQ